MGRTTFTNITPLPPTITRQTAVEFLHDHLQMIDLNPLIIDRHTIPPPAHAPPEEHRCIWYQLTDRISYLPGVSGKVSYTCAFHDLAEGLQTHCFAAMGLEIRDRWSVCGSLPGEPPQPVELGLNAPMSGLYLREDVDLRCSSIMMAFVKKTLKKAHGTLVDTLAEKAHHHSVNSSRMSMPPSANGSAYFPSPSPRSPGESSSLLGGTAPSLGSDSLAVSPIGPLMPPPRGHARSHSTPPTKQPPNEEPYRTYQLTDGPTHDHGPPQAGSNYLGAPPPLNGGLDYSGTVYRGSSKPHDYDEFSDLNPFEKVDPTLVQQQAPHPSPMYPAPLHVIPQDRRVKPAELE